VEEYSLAIIVPYRDRRSHLDVFVPHMDEFLSDKDIDYTIFIIEQDDDRPFNRGKLLNIGFDLVKDDFDYFCFHDVDMLPISDDCDYSYDDVPICLASEIESYDYKIPYSQFFGGVVLFTKEDFLQVNGYSNEYWGYGVEDLDMMYRIEKAELPHDFTYELGGVTNLFKYSLKEIKTIKSPIIKELDYITMDGSKIFSLNMTDELRHIPHHSYSISVWVRPHEEISGAKNFQMIISRPGHHTGISYNERGEIRSQVWNKSKLNFLVGREIKPNEWYNVVMSVNQEQKKISMFINGVESIDTYNRKEFSQELFYNVDSSWFLGSSYTNNNSFIGDISELKFYNFAMDEKMAVDNYVGEIDEKPFVNIDFSRGYKNTYFDLTGNHNSALTTDGDVYPTKHEKLHLGENLPLPFRKNGKYKSLKHDNDDNMLELYDSFDPDIGANLEIFFEDIRSGDIDYNTIGLSNLKYKLVKREEFHDRHEWIKVIT